MNNIKKYKKSIRSLFPIYGPQEKRFYTDLENNITEYTKNSTDISLADLENEFGTPAKIISDYLSNADTDYLYKQLSRTKYIKAAFISFLITCVIALAALGVVYYKAYQTFEENMPATEETEIEELEIETLE